MKNVCFYGLVFFALLSLGFPAGAVTYFNSKGKQIDAMEYEKANEARASTIKEVLSNGYGDEKTDFKDPVLLRKKRMEQWEAYRKAKP